MAARWPGRSFGAALGLATMPTWRVMLFGSQATIEDLLALRCPGW